ncbi:ABC-type amino acid transport/signal transduction system, periplasmic component [Rubidibacter lacunae KORDI 51-2]|uniref:ABC-type amino acid transport/signal transduction system, periplasmic component n=2 Tax=Rubidibacter TaxID=582491 RepID=U5DGI2_9CHRO|nr:ABC-type amino acid transport/signal transduction system, periplasmic component [Rubidibacter lacunae KORDI 51-2]
MMHRLLRTSIAALSTTFIASSAAIAADLEEIRARGRLIVAINDDARPLAFRDEGGELRGLEIDVARHLAETLIGDRQAVEFLNVSNRERLGAVLEGDADVAIARLSATPPRSRLVAFSNYYYLDGTDFVTRNTEIAAVSDLRRARIAVLENSDTIAIVRYRFPNADLVGVSSYQAAFDLLESEAADAFAGDRSILTGWVQEHPEYRRLDAQLSVAALCVAMPKGLQHARLHQSVNQAIARWQSSEWLRDTTRRWGLL